MAVFLLILSIVLFIGLVVVHEWGHFIAARRNGVEVEEFGIGFPPKVWAKKIVTKKSKFLFTINALPLGGFVKLKGENDSDTRPGSFGAATTKTKVKIMLAGVAMNLLVALLMFTLLALIGMPKLIQDQYTVPSDTKIIREIDIKAVEVKDGSPAAVAGIEQGDRIVSVAGTNISLINEVGEITKRNAGKTVPIVVERDGQTITLQATLNGEDAGDGYLGVASEPGEDLIQLQRSTWSAPIVAVGLTKQLTVLTFEGIGKIFSSLFKGDTKTASEQVSGPVGIAFILKEGSKIGISFILMIIAIISLTLAIMNALPIPALDGGRLFVMLLFKGLKKPLTKEREELIHGTGFLVLMALFVLITFVDIKRFF